MLERWGLRPVDASGLAIATLLLCLYIPPLMFDGWTPRMVVLLCVLPPGLVLLGRLVARRDLPATLLAVLLGWVLLSSAVGPAPRSALLGFAGRDLSALVVVASAACWAVGRSMTRRGCDALVGVVVWASTFGAFVGVLQVVVGVERGPLALAFGRPTSFYQNPVYYGAICAMGLAAAVVDAGRRWRPVLLVPIAVLGIGVSLSGSRLALLAAIVVFAAFVAIERSIGSARAVASGAVALVVGVVVDRLAGRGTNAVNRLAGADGGGRTQVWKYTLASVRDEPIWGWGLGNFRAAVAPRFSAEFVASFAPDETRQAWFDAHNVVIAIIVAIGPIGALLAAAWLVASARNARGTLVWVLVPLLAHWLLQPMSLFTLPVALLALGAAATRPEEPDEPAEPEAPVERAASGRLALAAATAVGAAGALVLLIGDIGVRSAGNALDGDRAGDFAVLFVHDPVVDDLVAQMYELRDDDVGRLHWSELAARHEPLRPYWWTRLADAQIALERYDDADRSLAEARRLQPHNINTLRSELLLAVRRQDRESIERLLAEACEFEIDECALDVDRLMAID